MRPSEQQRQQRSSSSGQDEIREQSTLLPATAWIVMVGRGSDCKARPVLVRNLLDSEERSCWPSFNRRCSTAAIANGPSWWDLRYCQINNRSILSLSRVFFRQWDFPQLVKKRKEGNQRAEILSTEIAMADEFGKANNTLLLPPFFFFYKSLRRRPGGLFFFSVEPPPTRPFFSLGPSLATQSTII